LCPMQARMVLATHCWTLLTPACGVRLRWRACTSGPSTS
jgi:hypothetical protein